MKYYYRSLATGKLISWRVAGIMMYEGYDQHAAAEIFRGRIRVSYDIGNYPVSTMFRYDLIH